jgi:hypothetical protein
MAHWLHRYLFRGLGVLFLIGILVILGLTVNYVAHQPSTSGVKTGR